MIWDTLKAARDLGRLHDVVGVLIRFGFSDLVSRLGLGHTLERAGRVLQRQAEPELSRLETAERFRHALEEMGPTYVKLGQILATRVEILPPDWIQELEKLQDQVAPVPFDLLLQQMQEDLGEDPHQIFSHIDDNVLAAGSIAQVHRASLASGEQLILKIRRPGIRSLVEADLRVIARIAELLEREVAELRPFKPVDLVRQFAQSMRRELDLAQECRNAERISLNLADNPHVVIPRIYWQWTSERLNVQEYLEGIAGRDLTAVESSGLDRRLLAVRGATAVLHMIIIDGLFHADPHPGNAIYLADNRIGFVDFGMVGRLSEFRKEQVIDLLYGLIERKTDEVVNVLMEWGGEDPPKMEDLSYHVDSFLDRYHGIPLKQLNLSAMMADVSSIMREHKLPMPADLTLLFKVFISLDGLGRQLDPDFDVVSVAGPYLKQAMLQRYAPDIVLKKGWRNLGDIVRLVSALPTDLRRLLKIAKRGSLQVNVDISRLREFGDQFDRSASRITIGLVTAALIIGSSIVMTITAGPNLFGLPLFGVLGFIGAALGGIWLLFSIWRGGHQRPHR